MIISLLELAAALSVAMIGAAGAVALWRGGSSTALETLQTANRVLEDRVHDLERQVKDLTTQNAALELKTDFAASIAPLMAWASSHEENAAKRSEQIVNLLGMIASQLGADVADAH